MSNQAQPSPEENEAPEAANQQAAPAAEQNTPSPDSPEGKARAGRLYFALIIVLFIFLGTIVAVYTFGEKVFVKIPYTNVTIFQTPDMAESASEQGAAAMEEEGMAAEEEAE